MRKALAGVLAVSLLSLYLAVYPHAVQAATMARDTSNQNSTGSNVTSFSVTATAAGSGEIAIIGCMTGGGGSAPNNVTGATVNGSAATLITTQEIVGAGGQWENLFYFNNPPTSSVNYTCNQSPAALLTTGVVLYTTAQQSGQPDAHNSVSTSGNFAVSVTTIADNDWLVGIARGNSCGAPTAGANTTRVTSTGDFGLFDSNGAQTPPGSHALNFNCSGGSDAAIVIGIAPTVNPCAYSGSGDWTVKYSSNCAINSTVSLATGAKLNIMRDGAGSFGVTIGGLIQALSGAVILRPGSNVLLDSTTNGAVFNTL